IPARGQVSAYHVQPSTQQRCDVLHGNVSGSMLANGPGKVSPQAGTFSGNSRALSGIANILAAACCSEEIDRRAGVSPDCWRVSDSDDVRPVSFEDPCRIFIHLHLPDCSHPCALKPKLQAADTGKKRADG